MAPLVRVLLAGLLVGVVLAAPQLTLNHQQPSFTDEDPAVSPDNEDHSTSGHEDPNPEGLSPALVQEHPEEDHSPLLGGEDSHLEDHPPSFGGEDSHSEGHSPSFDHEGSEHQDHTSYTDQEEDEHDLTPYNAEERAHHDDRAQHSAHEHSEQEDSATYTGQEPDEPENHDQDHEPVSYAGQVDSHHEETESSHHNEDPESEHPTVTLHHEGSEQEDPAASSFGQEDTAPFPHPEEPASLSSGSYFG